MKAVLGNPAAAQQAAAYLQNGGRPGGMVYHGLDSARFGHGMDAAGVAAGMAFIVGELEKHDPKLIEPLTSITWARDIVAKTGGGWLEFVSNYFADYAGVGNAEEGIIGGQTNNIPVMQADISKDIWRVFSWANILKVPFVDQAKLQGIGRNLESILDKGIRLNFQKTLDKVVYTGMSALKAYGLMNNPNITVMSASTKAYGGTLWKYATPEEIRDDINLVLYTAWAASEFSMEGMPNHILIPPLLYGYLLRTNTLAGEKSILKYVLENNLAKEQGVDLEIYPSRWCIQAGTGSTTLAPIDRLIAYVNDEDMVNFDLTVPLSRVMTQPDVTHMSYMTAFAGQFSEVKFLRFQPAKYMDGI